VQERKNWMEERIKEINSGGNFFEGAGKEARKKRE
jgi:hypothetical protein